jgi:hypothetical protein
LAPAVNIDRLFHCVISDSGSSNVVTRRSCRQHGAVNNKKAHPMRPLMAGGVGVYLDIAMVGGRRPAAAYDVLASRLISAHGIAS